MDVATFARLYEMQAPRIAWLFGAGASAAAGLPTAWQVTWDWKRRIYASEKNVRLSALDLADTVVQARIQRHFDQQTGCPARDSEDEYSFYFEKAYPRPEDRRAYLGDRTATGKPAFGHLALAALMSLGKVGVVWTTNFDRVIEDAATQVLGTTAGLTVATMDSPRIATEALRDQRFPLLVKLHGDFQSDRLKNITKELQDQDATLREALRRASANFGLAVVGYSGRDASVMEAIRQGLDGPGGYANGLYWFVRSADTPSPAVESLIEGARAKGISAHLIRYESFDDLFGRLLTPYVLPAHLDEVLKKAQPQPRLSPFAVPARSAGGFPVLRLNALLLESYPTTARRIGVSGIGGTREVKDAIVAAGVDAIAHRRHDGIVAFGADAALRTAFASFSPTDWDQAPLDPLAGPPTDVGLLYDAIVRAIARRSPFLIPQSRVLAVDPSQQDEGALAELRAAAGGLAGTIPKTTLGWFEAVELRLEARFNALWLIFQPTVWADREADTAERYVRGDFIRERLAGRHNRVSYPFVAAWAEILSAGVAECSAFGLAAGTGFDATFKIDATTAYARRGA
jgi:hypothetical protein